RLPAHLQAGRRLRPPALPLRRISLQERHHLCAQRGGIRRRHQRGAARPVRRRRRQRSGGRQRALRRRPARICL
ncbi:hypothetical protein KR018_009733, partial [Drosophila ironensis]